MIFTSGSIQYQWDIGVVTWINDAYMDEQLDLIEQLGVTWCRVVGFVWKVVEPQQGQFNELELARFKGFINGLRQRGVKPLLLIPLEEKHRPDWATNFTQMAPLVFEVVSKWNLDVIEIGNEPKWYFQGSNQNWVDAVAASYDAAKQANPDIKCVVGWGGGSPTDIWEPSFGLEYLFPLGFPDYFDALSIHLYTGKYDPDIGHPTDVEAGYNGYRGNIDELRRWLNEHDGYKSGLGNVEIWCTEWGFALGHSDPEVDCETEEIQIEHMIKGAFALKEKEIIANSWFNFWNPDPEGNVFSLTNPDMSPRELYNALKDLISPT